MVKKIELNALKENKVISLNVPSDRRVAHRVSSMSINGCYVSKSVWSVDKKPILEITSTVCGRWFIIIKGNKVDGYYFEPKEKSPYRWKVKFEY